MRIGVVGTGQVGLTLGTALTAAGHDVVYAGRVPGRPHDGLPAGETLHGIAETAASTDALLITVPGAAVADFVAAHGADLAGRLVLDTTNYGGRNAEPGAPLHQVATFLDGAPGIRLFRVFCTLGFEHFADPLRSGGQPDLYYCGPDDADRPVVEGIVTSLGLRPVRIGGLDAADVLDGATRLWFALAFTPGIGRDVAFRTLGLPDGGAA